MAIAFVTAAHASSASPSSPLVVSITINAGETAVLFFGSGGTAAAASSITGGGTWTKRATTASQGSHIQECWSTDASAATSDTSVSIAFTGAAATVAAVVATYSGVGNIGTTATNNGNTTTPTVSLTTQDNDNWVVSGLSWDDGSQTMADGPNGTLRDQGKAVAATDILVGVVDNTSASAGSVTCASAAFAFSGNWTAAALELRLAPPSAAITGTATASITEADIVSGGKTIIATLTGDTYVTSAGFETLTFVGDAKNAGLGNAALTVDLSGISMQQGDLVLVAYGVVNTADHVMAVTTSGYTELFEDYADDSRDANGEVAYKIMGATPDTSVVLANPGALSTNSFVACVQVWRGVDQGTPIDAATVEAEGINSSVSDSPSITTVTDNALVVSVGVNTGAAADLAVTSPTGYTNQTEHSSDPGTSIRVMMASKIVPTAGAEDPAAWGGITTTTSDSWLGFTVALRPAATTPFADAKAAIRSGIDSAQSEANGWDARRATIVPDANIVRTSDTVCTITLAADASYDITAQETITVTIPATAVTGASAIVGSPTFTIATSGGGGGGGRTFFTLGGIDGLGMSGAKNFYPRSLN